MGLAVGGLRATTEQVSQTQVDKHSVNSRLQIAIYSHYLQVTNGRLNAISQLSIFLVRPSNFVEALWR